MEIAYSEEGLYSIPPNWSGTFVFPAAAPFRVDTHWDVISKTCLPIEVAHDAVPSLLFTNYHFWTVWLVVIGYLTALFTLQRVMKNRQAFELRWLLGPWNLALSIFSMIGTFRLGSQIAYQIWTFGLLRMLSLPAAYFHAQGPIGMWITFFVWSKFFELIDTLFLVLRKKPVGFLHWYHHASVMIFTWYAFSLQQHASLLYAFLNYFCHSVMYYYYYLSASNKRRPSWGMVVTLLQVAQMVIGMVIAGVCAYLALYYPFKPDWTMAETLDPQIQGHTIHAGWLGGSAIMYLTYLGLFTEVFVGRYVYPAKEAKKKLV